MVDGDGWNPEKDKDPADRASELLDKLSGMMDRFSGPREEEARLDLEAAVAEANLHHMADAKRYQWQRYEMLFRHAFALVSRAWKEDDTVDPNIAAQAVIVIDSSLQAAGIRGVSYET